MTSTVGAIPKILMPRRINQLSAANIDRDEAARLLKRLVRIRSVNPGGDLWAGAEFINKWLSKNGIGSEMIEFHGVPNVLAAISGKKHEGKTLLWNGHFDVVPTEGNWSVDPFSGDERDGYLYGRGSCDMKSGIAAMMLAMKELNRTKDFKGKIVLTAVGDEETGSVNGTLGLLRSGRLPHIDYAVVSEPTDLRVELGNRGLRWLEVTVRGLAAHAGRPYLGKNAISVMAKIVGDIDAIDFERIDDRFTSRKTTVSCTMIHGGLKENIIPDLCKLTIDMRLLPGDNADSIMNMIGSITRARESKDCSTDLQMLNVVWDPYTISADEDVVTTLIDSYKHIIGKNPKITYKDACTDASHLSNVGSIPTVLFGPGNDKLSHKVDERVEIEKVAAAARIYCAAASNLLSH